MTVPCNPTEDAPAASDAPDELEAVQDERPSFEKRLENLINQYSMENGSNTPDFILAKYMSDCLAAFNAATVSRSQWYNQK